MIQQVHKQRSETVEERFEGLTARCYTHELDHMNVFVLYITCKVSLDKARRNSKTHKRFLQVERRNCNDIINTLEDYFKSQQ